VIYWLRERGIEPTEELVDRVFAHAKTRNETLGDDEILALIKAGPPPG
jgi:hypothetical protein